MSNHPVQGRSPAPDIAPLERMKRYGTDAVSFQALKPGLDWWIDERSGAAVAYLPAGRSWIAVGTPLAEPERRAEAVRRFCRAARASRRRPVFFGVENETPFAGCRILAIGLQPILKPSEWERTLARWPRLREQLRRARAKGVTVREVAPAELAPSMPLRDATDRLRDEWLHSRTMESMAFLVEASRSTHPTSTCTSSRNAADKRCSSCPRFRFAYAMAG